MCCPLAGRLQEPTTSDGGGQLGRRLALPRILFVGTLVADSDKADQASVLQKFVRGLNYPSLCSEARSSDLTVVL